MERDGELNKVEVTNTNSFRFEKDFSVTDDMLSVQTLLIFLLRVEYSTVVLIALIFIRTDTVDALTLSLRPIGRR